MVYVSNPSRSFIRFETSGRETFFVSPSTFGLSCFGFFFRTLASKSGGFFFVDRFRFLSSMLVVDGQGGENDNNDSDDTICYVNDFVY